MRQHQIHVLSHRDQERRRAAKEGCYTQDIGSVFIRTFIFNTKTLPVQTKWYDFKQNQKTLK